MVIVCISLHKPLLLVNVFKSIISMQIRAGVGLNQFLSEDKEWDGSWERVILIASPHSYS